MQESVHDDKYDNTERLDDVKEAKGRDMTHPDDTEECVDVEKNENKDDEK